MNGFFGLPTRHISSEFVHLEVLEHAGPRIVRLHFRDSSNLFAEIPDFVVPTEYGDYHMWGGHRLWHAPEAMPRTYFLEDDGNTITELQDGILMEGQVDPHTGIRKSIEVRLAKNKPEVHLVHTLSNHGDQIVKLAPWSITQLRLGGVAIAPMPRENADPHGLLPNRNISLWPYTRIRDPRLHWDDDFLLLKANAGLPPFKIGYFNPHGWLAYWINDVLFRKTTDVHPHASHPDGNCNAEIFCNDRFFELESLAPLHHIAPGEQVRAMETWDLLDELNDSGLENVTDRISHLMEFG
jgi:hypothetical protein